jgi:hypothetical protein
MHPSEAKQTTAREAFSRIQTELRSAAATLSKQFSRKFSAGHLHTDESIWILDMEGAPGPWTGTAFRFDEHAGTIVTDPSANFSSIPGDHHEFTLNAKSGQFTENGQTVTDDDLVRRASEQFLRSALGMS